VVSEIVQGVVARPRHARPARASLSQVLRSHAAGPAPALALVDGLAVVTVLAVTGWTDAAVVAFLVLALGAWLKGGLYRSRLSLSALDDMPRLLGGILAASGATLLLVAAIGAEGAAPASSVLRAALVLAVSAVLLRAALYRGLVRLRVRGLLSRRAVLVGSGDESRRLRQVLGQHPEYGVEVVGHVEDAPSNGTSSRRLGVPHLPGIVAGHDASLVLVTAGGTDDPELETTLRRCAALGCEVRVVPRLAALHPDAAGPDSVWGLPLLRLAQDPRRRPSWRLKRLLDIVVALVAAVVLAPVLLATAAAVRLETGPTVIFRQVRVGAGGRLFTLLKFRSLRTVDDAESQTCWSVADDSRVGPVGRVIRALSLDELPQLWNILRGDMTLVGPRPERPFFVERFSGEVPCYDDRHRAPAGLTGLAAVHGLRGDTSIEDRARFDNAYLESWSLWLDVKIMLRTVRAVLRRSEAPAEPNIPRQATSTWMEGGDVA
jgi:exopolysaccharide biosynthesis polyprenyl glycosylphosphotransferase